jgi:hypothetical protein
MQKCNFLAVFGVTLCLGFLSDAPLCVRLMCPSSPRPHSSNLFGAQSALGLVFVSTRHPTDIRWARDAFPSQAQANVSIEVQTSAAVQLSVELWAPSIQVQVLSKVVASFQ